MILQIVIWQFVYTKDLRVVNATDFGFKVATVPLWDHWTDNIVNQFTDYSAYSLVRLIGLHKQPRHMKTGKKKP